MSILWVIDNLGWNEGALAGLWAGEIFAADGIQVVLQPLREPEGPPLPIPKSLETRPALRVKRFSRRPNLSFEEFDRVIVDQDFRTELSPWLQVRSGAGRYLFARQPTLPKEFDVTPYHTFDGVLAINRSMHGALATHPALLASRLWSVPLLVASHDAKAPDWPFHGSRGSVLVTAGVIDAVKGLDLLANALALLEVEGHSLPLIVLGDGPDRPRLTQYFAALGVSAHFVPAANGWAGWIRSADLLVALQFNEGLMADLTLAGRLGIPVLGAEHNAARERVEPSQALWIKEPTVVETADCLRRQPWPPKQAWPNPPDLTGPWRDALKL